MKGLILSGGKGTRLRPFTYTGAKQLVPLANKPVLFYAIEDLVEAGIESIGIVISPETGDQVKTTVGDGSQFGAQITYILQDAPRGIAHGIKIAQDFVGDESFVLFLGDNFLREGIVSQVKAFTDGGLNAQIILYPMDDPSSMGVAVLDEAGRVTPGGETQTIHFTLCRHWDLYVRSARLRSGQRHQTFGARRAGDHRDHSVSHRSRLQSGRPAVKGLVDRYGQDVGHSGG